MDLFVPYPLTITLLANEEDVMVTIKIVILGILFVINIWVWLYGHSFINFFGRAEKSPIEQQNFQKEKWKVIYHPRFIWYPRLIMLITFLTIILFFIIDDK